MADEEYDRGVELKHYVSVKYSLKMRMYSLQECFIYCDKLIILMDRILNKILNEPFQLSDDQQIAINSNSRYTRIIAGAGAGKTETLARKILYYLIYKKIAPSSIVAFTFTEKAAESMKSRIHQRLLELGELDLLRKFGEMYVGTIHGYCTRLLQDKYEFSNYTVLDENQQMAFIIREGYNIGLNKTEYAKYGSYLMRCKIFIATLNAYYSELIDLNSLQGEDEHFKIMLKRYESLLKEHHKLTFDTLITTSILKLQEDQTPLSNLNCLVVDEFQDVNKAQYVLIRLMSQKAEVTIVGDPRQSIYQWRGGNPKFFEDFIKEFERVQTYEISENRRSPREIVQMSNRVSKNFSDAKFSDMTWKRENRGLISKVNFLNAEQEANEIAYLAKDKHVPYSNFGILLRSIKTSADPLINAFKSINIPYIVGGKVGLFKRDEAQALGMFITGLLDNGYWQLDAYGSQTISGENLRLQALSKWKGAIRYDLIDDEVETGLVQWKKKVLNSVPSDNYGYKDVLHELLNILGYKKLNQDDILDAVVMANVGAFSKILGDFETSFRLGGKRRRFETELRDLCNFLNGYALMSYDEQPYEEEEGLNAVSIMTIHQSKGLQWPIVFLPSMINSRFPSRRKTNPEKIWMINPGVISNDGYFEKEDSELRLFYVAITRAMNAVILSYFDKNTKQSTKPSEYFDVINDFCLSVKELRNLKLFDFTTKVMALPNVIESFPVKELIDYEMCPFHYRLSKKWRYIQGVNTFMGYGDALHHILQLTSQKIKNNGEKYDVALDDAIKNFYLPYASPEFRDELLKNVKHELLDYMIKNGEYLANVKETEMRIEFPAKNATIIGKVDVILRSNIGLEVRDYKSSESVMKSEHSVLQVLLYAKGLRDLGWDIIKGSVANLKNNKVEDVTVSENNLKEAMERAEGIIDKIKAHSYQPKPSEFCEKCEYRTICYKAASNVSST